MAISAERMQQLTALATKIKANPELMKQFGGQQTTPSSISKRAGLQGATTKGVFEDIQKTAIDETSPEYLQGQEARAQLKGAGAIPTGGNIGGVTYKVPSAEGPSNKIKEDLGERYGQAARVVGSMRNLVGQYKRLDDEFEGKTGAKAAIIYDLGRWRYSPDFIKEASIPLQPAAAQAEEVGISMMPILSGQARYVASLADRVAKTVPDVSVIPESRNDLIAQSVRNMMTIAYGIENGTLGSESLIKMGIDPNSEVKDDKTAQILLKAVQLKPEQNAAIEDAINYVLDAPKIKSTKKGKNNIEILNKLNLDPNKFEIVE